MHDVGLMLRPGLAGLQVPGNLLQTVKADTAKPKQYLAELSAIYRPPCGCALAAKPSSLPLSVCDRWWTSETVAVVSGANRGIGFEIAKQISEQGLTVIVACRNPLRGQKAACLLASSASASRVLFHRLDIACQDSIQEFVTWLHKTTGGLDILRATNAKVRCPVEIRNHNYVQINNAAISCKKNVEDNSMENFEEVLATNYHGTKYLTQSLLPLFRRSAASARILFISSRIGSLHRLQNNGLRQILQNPENITEALLDMIATEFKTDVKNGAWISRGWPSSWTDYSMSKLLLNAYAWMLAHKLQTHTSSSDGAKIMVNCYCPGFTKTSMTNGMGKYTAAEAAARAVYLTLIPCSEMPTAQFFHPSSSFFLTQSNLSSSLTFPRSCL